MKSRLESVKRGAGKQRISVGMSNGTLTNPTVLHLPEKEEAGDKAVTNATSGENDATATVNASRTVHAAAYNRRGHEGVLKLGNHQDIKCGL